MNDNKINWVHDFAINELLHSTAQKLSGVYGRLMFHFPTSANYALWQQRSLSWAEYDRSVEKLVFDSQSAGESEIDRIAKELREMLAIENDLMKNSGKVL